MHDISARARLLVRKRETFISFLFVNCDPVYEHAEEIINLKAKSKLEAQHELTAKTRPKNI